MYPFTCPIAAPHPCLPELCASHGILHLSSYSLHPQLQASVLPQRLRTLGCSSLSSQQQWAGLHSTDQAWGHPRDWQGRGVVQPEYTPRHLCCCYCSVKADHWG